MKKYLSPPELKELLDYNPQSGVLTWKTRIIANFENGSYSAARKCAAWNARYAGHVAKIHLDAKAAGRLKIHSIFYPVAHIIWAWMTGSWPVDGQQIDHKDIDPKNNSWANLRIASISQNNANRRKQSNNRSGFKGVCWRKSNAKWQAAIKINGKKRHLGYFQDPSEAHMAYQKAAQEAFGEFARFS